MKKNLNLGTELESANVATTGKLSKNAMKKSEKTVDFSDREFLENNSPEDYFVDGNTSSKYEAERETKIQAALPIIATMQLGEVSINPLLVLLAKWWEVKPARTAIKKMIDAEAEVKGYESAYYLQEVLSKEVDAFSEVQSAIDRIRYAKTYFKPRAGVSNKVITQLMNIDGQVYIVPKAQLEELKVMYANDKALLKSEVIKISTLQTNVIDEL